MTNPSHNVPIEVTSETFAREVLGSDLPVLVDYWAEWCGPCRVLGPTVDAVAQRLDGRVRVSKVNVDENPSIADTYGIRSIPTLMLFKDGKVSASQVGVQSEQQLLDWIDTQSRD